MIWQDIVEARSNPDKNPRRHLLTELLKYEGQKDIFVSFTASFDTHMGPQLLYPNKKVKSTGGQNKIGLNPRSKYETPIGIYTYPVDYVIDYSKQQGDLAAPFMGESKWGFLYILRRNTENFIDDASDIGPLFVKLRDLAIEVLGEHEGAAVFSDAVSTAKDMNDPRSKCWNLARLLSARVAGRPGFGKSAPVAWNVVMRKVGVDAYIDDGGRGIIHYNEPTQAVFFSTQAFRVVDCLQSAKEVTSKREQADRMVEAIRSRKLDVNTVNPMLLRKVFDHSWDLETEDFAWVASKLEPVQKRIVNETFKTWPSSIPFDDASLAAMRLFGPIPSETVIYKATEDYDGNLADFPKWLDHQPTDAEWAAIFKEYTHHGIDPNMKLLSLKAPWVDEAFLLSAFKARMQKFPDVGIIQTCAEQNGVEMTPALLEESFVRDPARTVKSFPKQEWTFKQWYRAMRTNNHMEKGLGEIVPLEVVMPILMREDRKSFMDRALLKRLIAEKPEFVASWFPNYGAMVWHQNWPELNEFVAKYLPVMAARNPDMLRFLTVDKGTKPSPRVLQAIWRDLKLNGSFAVRTVEWALKQHWITQEDFTKHLTPAIAPLVHDWQRYGWGYVEDDLWVDALVMNDEVRHLVADYIPTLMRRHPEHIRDWSGKLSHVDAREVFEEYPEARSNTSVLLQLDEKSVYDFFHDGRLSYEHGSEMLRFRIIHASLVNDPHTGPKLADDNGPFRPLPMDYTEWRARIPVESLVDGGVYGIPASHDFAWLMYKAYSVIFPDLQLIVERRTMEKLIHDNLNQAVVTHPFGNPIPDDLLGPAQIAFVDKATSNWQNRNIPIDNLHDIVVMLFSKMAKPTQEARMHFAKILNPPTPNS